MGAALTCYEKRVVPEQPLSNSAKALPHSTSIIILIKQSLGGSMGSAAGPPYVGDSQQSPDKTGHPVVGIGYVVVKVEAKPTMEVSCGKVGFYLPEVVIELVPPVSPQQRSQARWQPNVVKMNIGQGPLSQSLLDA